MSGGAAQLTWVFNMQSGNEGQWGAVSFSPTMVGMDSEGMGASVWGKKHGKNINISSFFKSKKHVLACN